MVSMRGLASEDDEVIVAKSTKGFQKMLGKLDNTMKNIGPKINVNETKIVVFRENH